MKLRIKFAVVAAVLAALALTARAPSSRSASPDQAGSTPQVEIPFANFNIYDWAADGERGIYIETLDHHWYYAKLFGPCINLPFATRVGFVTEPGNGVFDRFSSIIVQGQQCPVESLTKSGAPAARYKRWRNREGSKQAKGENGSSGK